MSRTARREHTVEVYAADAERSRTKTFREAAELCIQAVSPTWRNPRTAKMWMQSLQLHAFPMFGDKPIDEITSAEIIRTLDKIWRTTPMQARKVKQRVRGGFRLGTGNGAQGLEPRGTLPHDAAATEGHGPWPSPSPTLPGRAQGAHTPEAPAGNALTLTQPRGSRYRGRSRCSLLSS